MDAKPRVIATVINDVIYDQRMIRICTSLSDDYEVTLIGRKKSSHQTSKRPFKQKRLSFLVNSGPIFYLIYNIRVFFILLFSRFDIIHSVDLDTLIAGYFASKVKGKKLIYDSHEYFTEVPELINRPTKRKLWLFVEKSILPKVKNAITVGEMIALEYQKKYGVPFKVVMNCPKLETDLTLKDNEGEPYLLYQGALNKGRGLESLLHAILQLDIKLKIAGSGDLDKELRELSQKLKVDHKVEFLGMLPPSRLPALTQNAFAGINVSENLGLSYYYSLNNKFFDYIHSGLPAITNPFPEYQKLNDLYNCCVFASSKSEEIVDAVNLLLNDKVLYDRLRKNALLARQKLNWGQEEKKLLAIYADIR